MNISSGGMYKENGEQGNLDKIAKWARSRSAEVAILKVHQYWINSPEFAIRAIDRIMEEDKMTSHEVAKALWVLVVDMKRKGHAVEQAGDKLLGWAERWDDNDFFVEAFRAQNDFGNPPMSSTAMTLLSGSWIKEWIEKKNKNNFLVGYLFPHSLIHDCLKTAIKRKDEKSMDCSSGPSSGRLTRNQTPVNHEDSTPWTGL